MATETTKVRMGEAAHALREDFRELRGVTGEAARETAQEVRQKLTHAVSAGREKVEHAADDVRARVRANPLRWVAISAGVGVVVGYVLHRRRVQRRAGSGD